MFQADVLTSVILFSIVTFLSAVNRSSGLLLFKDWFFCWVSKLVYWEGKGAIRWAAFNSNARVWMCKWPCIFARAIINSLSKLVSHYCFPFGFLHLCGYICSVLCFRSCSMSVYRYWVPSFLWVQWALIRLLRAMRNAGKSSHWFTELDFVVFGCLICICSLKLCWFASGKWVISHNFLFWNREEKICKKKCLLFA